MIRKIQKGEREKEIIYNPEDFSSTNEEFTLNFGGDFTVYDDFHVKISLGYLREREQFIIIVIFT